MNRSKYIYLFGYDSPLKMLSALGEDTHNTAERSRAFPAFGKTQHTGRVGETMVSLSGGAVTDLVRVFMLK